MKATKNPTTRATRRYVIEFTLAIVLYMVVLFGTRTAFRSYEGPFYLVIALAPMVPVLLVFLAALRLFQGTDEFTRTRMIESLAIAGVITALFAATYMFVDGDPLPHPSAWWTWTTFMASWLVATIVQRMRDR